MSNNINTGRIKQFHFGIESAFGDGVTQSASTLIEALEGSSIEFQQQNRHDNMAANGTRDGNDKILGRKQEVPFNLECHALMMPDASTASSIEPLILAALGATSARTTPNDQTVLSGSTKTIVKVTDASGFELFDGVQIDGSIAFVTKVNTSSNEITVAPPLLATPTVSSAIGKTRTIHLADAQPTIGMDAKLDWMTLRCSGGVVKSLSLEPSGAEPVKLKVNGVLSGQVLTSRATLASAVASSGASTFTVDNPYAFEVGSIFDCESETGIVVTDVDNDNDQITVTRGASPAAHNSGEYLTPTWTSGSVSGSPAHGSSGRGLRGIQSGEAVSIPAVSRSFSMETGAELINDEDGSTAPSYSVAGARKVSGSRTLHLRELDVEWLRKGQMEDYGPEVYEMSAGSRKMAVFMPRVSLNVPSVSEGTQRDISQEYEASFAQDDDGADVSNRVVVMALC